MTSLGPKPSNTRDELAAPFTDFRSAPILFTKPYRPFEQISHPRIKVPAFQAR